MMMLKMHSLIQDFFQLAELLKRAIQEALNSLPSCLADLRLEGLKFGSLFTKLGLPNTQSVLAAVAQATAGDLNLDDLLRNMLKLQDELQKLNNNVHLPSLDDPLLLALNLRDPDALSRMLDRIKLEPLRNATL
jgi:hypothetical protein